MNTFTPAEQMIVCMSRSLASGDTIGLGTGSAFPVAAALLAARTHAPGLYMYTPGTGTYGTRIPAAALSLLEWRAVPASLRHAELAEVLTEGLDPHHKVFMRPAQIDSDGNSNNTVIGAWNNPKIRLPGASGIPDVTAVYSELMFYVPRHNALTFVPRVDFVSAVGRLPDNPARRRAMGLFGRGPRRLVSDLGVFEFSSRGLEVVSLHDGVAFAVAQERTGFPIATGAIAVTEPPTADELALLRDEIDPFGVRELEMVGSAQRAQMMREIWEKEFRP
jgi:glutaconate CoA-transferase subunit B